jgi:hypothetical protein
MSAESAESAESANQSAKKRSFSTISNRKPKVFTFSNRNIDYSQTMRIERRKPVKHNFSAVSNANIKQDYGRINTLKGGKRSGKRSGQKTHRHRSRRNRR